MIPRRSILVLVAALGWTGLASGQSPASGGRVAVSLVAEAGRVEAGKPLTVGIKLEHPPGIHTYWINPGIGSPTKVAWSLPDGWKAGELIWPVPTLKVDDAGGSNVYEGTIHLLCEITPGPGFSAGQTATVKAIVTRLECDDTGCRPAKSDVSVAITAAAKAGAAAPATAAFDAVRAQQPVASTAWKIEVRPSNTTLTVVLSPQAGASTDPGEVVFFDRTGAVSIAKPRVTRKAGGVLEVILAREPVRDPPVAPAGYLHASKGWLADGSVPSLAYPGRNN